MSDYASVYINKFKLSVKNPTFTFFLSCFLFINWYESVCNQCSTLSPTNLTINFYTLVLSFLFITLCSFYFSIFLFIQFILFYFSFISIHSIFDFMLFFLLFIQWIWKDFSPLMLLCSQITSFTDHLEFIDN